MTNDIRAKGIGEAIGTLIAKLCYRAADDFGNDFAARTGEWRRANALNILQDANKKYELLSFDGSETAPPRLVHHILEEGSWTDDDHVHTMWAGLLASSCTESGDDEGNLIFINILKQLTGLEVFILDYVCENCTKTVSEHGWVAASFSRIERDALVQLTGVSDVQRLDRELDHLRSLELIFEGFNQASTEANITPTALALHMYVRCQGYVGSPIDYFGLTVADASPS